MPPLRSPLQRSAKRHACVTRALAFVGAIAAASGATTITTEGLARADEGQSRTELADPARDQLDADLTIVPDGYGALFVPALESDLDPEASVIVELDGETLSVGKLGQRIPLPPGHYRALVGTGPREARSASEIVVVAGETTTLAPSYGVMRISIVDPNGKPEDETYVVGALDTGRSYGPFRPSFKPGQRASIALYLPPGRYVFALGKDPKARDNSVAVLVAAGDVLHYRVVVEDGRIMRTEFGEAATVREPSIFKVRWTLAADGTLGSRLNQLSSYNGDALTLGAYTRLDLGIDTGRHLAEASLLADFAAVGILSSNGASEFPIQKVTDDVRAEVLYNYRLGGVAGPYAHATGYTSLFPTRYYAPVDLRAVTTNEAGNVVRDEAFRKGDDYRLFPELGPLVVQEGAGIGTKVDLETFRFAFRGGLAARQAFFFDGRAITSQAGTNLNLLQLDDVKTLGVEATAMCGITVRNLLDIDSRLDGFLGENQFGSLFKDEGKYRPVYRWDTTASLKLSRHVALVYTLGLRRDTQALEKDQISHSLRLRLQWSVF